MDAQIEASILDVTDSFRSLSKLDIPQIELDDDELKGLKTFHKTIIRLNLKSLLTHLEKF